MSSTSFSQERFFVAAFYDPDCEASSIEPIGRLVSELSPKSLYMLLKLETEKKSLKFV